jgi:chromosome segregation ATPase
MNEVTELIERGGDPFAAIMDRSRAELKAVMQQTEAARATLAALQNTLAATQQQVDDLQGKAAALQQAARDAEEKAARIIADAKTQAGVISAEAAKESKQLIDDAKARVAAAARFLNGDTAGAA